MRGEILHYDDGTATGLITGEDGNRYGFALSAFRRPVTPLQGMLVDFITDGAGAAHEIYPIATTTPTPQFRPTPVAPAEPDLGPAERSAVEPQATFRQPGEKGAVVADDDERALEAPQPILEPLDRTQIEVVGGLVEQ